MDKNVPSNSQELQPLAASPRINPKTNDSEFTVFHMVIYGLAATAYWILTNSLVMFSTKFLLDVPKLPASLVSIIVLVSRVVDVISDPVCAYFVNKSRITKYGKMKPW